MVRLVLLLSLVLGGASVAHASIITINPNDYPFGTDLSTLFDGVTISRIKNDPDALSTGPGRKVYQPLHSPVYAVETYHAPEALSVGGFGYDLYAFDACSRSNATQGSLSCDEYSVIEFLFTAPTDYVQISSVWFSDGPGVLAFDALGNRITFGNDSTEVHTSLPGPNARNATTFTVTRPQADIARLVYGGLGGNATAAEVEFHRVPEPSTLLVVSIGALALIRKRRQAR